MYSVGCELISIEWDEYFWLPKNTYFVWLEALTLLANNPINIFLRNPNKIFYYFVLFLTIK